MAQTEITGYSDMKISYGGVDVTLSTKDYYIEDYKQESLKFEFDNQYNIQYLYKKGNRWLRKIVVTQIKLTNAQFKALFISLDRMNGMPITLMPHIDQPDVTQLTWMTVFWDRYNIYPNEQIIIDLQAVDIE
jgi:uncharacterized membrane protein